MTPDEAEPLDDPFTSLLAAYEEALLKGKPPPAAAGDAELRPRLQRALACVQVLQQMWPTPPPDQPPATERSSSVDGRYTLASLHATGGIGQVWLAHDTELDREVALKELRPERAGQAAFQARFLHEARIAGRLQHPGIVPVYEMVAGADGEPPFYTMRFVRGRTLTEAVKTYHEQRGAGTAGPLEQRALLGAFVSVCHTIAYAHARGVIHRDLKGQNVVLGDFGEVIVIDWGFAKVIGEPEAAAGDIPLAAALLEARPDETIAGQVLGTPAYMAPEQAAGQRDRIDQRTDVYGLGAILYEILTGRPPFSGAETQEVLRRARTEEPPRPGSVCARVPPALEAICWRAVAREPADRYPSATELARDIERWLADEPTTAYREPPAARLQRWGRRHRPIVAGLSVLLLSGLTAGVLGMVLLDREQTRTAEARARAAVDQAAAEGRAKQALEIQLYFQRIALAERELSAHSLSRATELLDTCPPELRGWEWHCLKRLCHVDQVVLRGHEAAVSDVLFSRDGRRLYSAAHDNTIRVWDVATGKELHVIRGHDDAVYGLALSPDGRQLASASWDGTVKLWDTATNRALRTLGGHPGKAMRVVYSPDGRTLVSLSLATLTVWDATTGAQLRRWADVKNGGMYGLAFSPDGKHVATAGGAQFTKVWDVSTGALVRVFEGHEKMVKRVAFSPGGTRLASGDGDLAKHDPGMLKIWDIATGRALLTLSGHTEPIWGVAYSPDGQRLVSASQDNTVKVWDLASGREALTLRGHTDTVRGVAFSPDGRKLASASADATIRIWDAAPWQHEASADELLTLHGHPSPVFAVTYSPDGKRLVSLDSNNVKVWDAATGRELHSHLLKESGVYALAYRPDGRQLITGNGAGFLYFLDGQTGKPASRFNRQGGGPMKGVAFSTDGERLITANWDRQAKIWDVRTRREIHTLKGHTEEVVGVAFSPDGALAATASFDRTVKIWDSRTARELQVLRGHASRVQSVVFRPDGKLLATAGNDGLVKLWDTATWKEVRALRGHTAGVSSVAFNRDGSLLASAGDDWTVKLWDATTGSELHTFRGHLGSAQCVAFSLDGSRLASASHDRTVKVWKVPVGHRRTAR
jgi:eukaryotic-like serine/threonine-protein kinase